jgi:quercetin dioxygenase-like cupin family protein
MLIRNIDEVQKQPVQMDGVRDATMAIMVGRADGAPNFAMRQFVVAPGGNTPRHSHDYEHEVFVVSGKGTIFLDGADRPVRGGDAIYVPADEEHQFRASPDEPLRFLCMVPMSRDCGGAVPGS